MILAGLGFVAKNITWVLAPAFSSDILLAPMFLNMVVLAVWMLGWGVDLDKWNGATADERD